jgi:hypothetical protein
MTQEQIKELREDFNKHQSEIKNTIKRETTQIIKEDNTYYKREVEQRYGKPQKEESNRNLEKKVSNSTPPSKDIV